MRNVSIQSTVRPLEQPPINEWYQYIHNEVHKAEKEALEKAKRHIMLIKVKKATRSLNSKRRAEKGMKKVLLSARSIISN